MPVIEHSDDHLHDPDNGRVQFVGPFETHDVIVDGVRVPYIHAHPKDGGKVVLICDRAVGIELPVEQAEAVASFVAFAMRVAERGTPWPTVHNVTDAR